MNSACNRDAFHVNMRLAFTTFVAVLSSLQVVNADILPNIVIICIDDLGYGDIGPFGATRQATPQLDRMASEGMKLLSFYTAPVCSASRAQLMTGCYHSRVSIPGVLSPASPTGLNPSEITLAEHLKRAGYSTACVGKWHLGDQTPFLPLNQGFDQYFGLPYSNDMQLRPATGGPAVVPLLQDNRVIELLTESRQSGLTTRYTDAAVGFIQNQKARPFFLYLAYNQVHVPLHSGPGFAGKSANRKFGDCVEEIDASTGRLLQTLRDLKLAEKTLVLFVSDNGP